MRAVSSVSIHLINLDRSTDRMAEFRAVNSHVGEVQRIPAIDGKSLDIPGLVKHGIVRESVTRFQNPGAIGTILSHIGAWETAIESGQPMTVCEDDAIFNHHFHDRAESIMKDCPPDWDIVLWGWNFDSVLYAELLPGVSPMLAAFDQEKMRAGASHFQTLDFTPLRLRLFKGYGTICYTISPKGAQQLRAACLPIRELEVSFPGREPEIKLGVDIMMAEAYSRLSAWVSFPPLVITKNEISKSPAQPIGGTS